MSSTEPPSGASARQSAASMKAVRDELSSKGRVEKVREVDPDEQARKQKFQQHYPDKESKPQETKKSVYDLSAGIQDELLDTEKKEKKKETTPSLFALPEKPEPTLQAATKKEKEKKEEKSPAPFFETPTSPLPHEKMPAAREKWEGRTSALKKNEQEEAEMTLQADAPRAPIITTTEGSTTMKEGKKEKENILAIETPSLSKLPEAIHPLATAATTQAAPYLTSHAVSLSYQMVGTIYMMSNSQGINRTEILLNNPAFANSKFFGATITIEKYVTAPGTFNIRLTGTAEAVAAFRDNIPSLLSAFENGNFPFRVGRIDAEYTFEKPIFHRKEKATNQNDAGGGNLGEGKK